MTPQYGLPFALTVHTLGLCVGSPWSIIVVISLLSCLLTLATRTKFSVYNALVSAVSWLSIYIQGAVAVGALVVVCRHFWLRSYRLEISNQSS